MLRFLRVLTLFLVAFLSFDRVSCAGDFTSCVGSMTYVECDAGYYLSDCGSYRDGRTITRPAAGNSCKACPGRTSSAYYECSGGAVCPKNMVENEFRISINVPKTGTVFGFNMSASGVFYVNWGDGSLIEKIDRTSLTANTGYPHTYKSTGTKTITISGQATAYNDSSYSMPAINFYYGSDETAKRANTSMIRSVSGSLGSVFGTLSTGKNPRFNNLFSYAVNLTSVPAGLFSGLTGTPASNMFGGLLNYSGIREIPAGLFGNLSGAMQPYLFSGTFKGCTGLTSIPDGLFANFTGTARYMFKDVFKDCTGLTSIPANLFGNISTGTANDHMFYDAFNGCTALTGRSAKFNGKYVYEIWPDATTAQVGGMYTNATGLADYPCIPTNYGGAGTGVCVDISYDANGGTGNPPTSPIVCIYGQPCTVPENTYTYSGKIFGGWKRMVDGGILYPGPGQDILSGLTKAEVSARDSITLSAQWGNPIRTVTLNNTDMGGIGGTTGVYTTDGVVFYSDAAGTTAIRGIRVPTKQNATYMGHYTTSATSGGAQCIGQSGEFTFASGCEVTSDTRWYARYQCNTGWTDAGTVISGICSKNITVNLNNLYATKKGTEILYARAGSGETFFDENHTNVMPYITIPENVPVFTFDANGGTVDLSSFAEDPNIARVAENSLTFLPVAFTGFYSEKSGGTQYIDATGALTEAGMVAIAKSTGNLTWYAQWNTGATISPMPTPVRDGYMFGQWVGTYDIDGQPVTVSGFPGQRVTVPTSVDFVINWTPKCNEITLNPNAGTAGSTTTLYKLTDSDPWYIDSECSAQLKDLSSVIPSRVGYLFRGFYPQSNEEEFEGDIAADYETSIPAVITSDMIMPEWNTTSASTLYASWVKECDVPDNGKCSVSIGPGGQIVDYTTSCAVGYTLGNENTATPSCTANTYNVRYMPNATNATGTMADELHTFGVEQNLTPNAFTNGTKQFLGWSKDRAATEPEYMNGESVINLSDGRIIRLYAVWGDCTPCAAGTGATCELSAPLGVCTYVGACQPGYGNLVGGDTATPVCTANTYNVRYMPNATNATGVMADDTHTYGVEQNLTPNAFTNGTKQFLGWSKDRAATEPEYMDGESVINLSDGNNIRLFAVWGDCAPCAAGTGATCELSAPLGVCTYVGACKIGYNTLVGGDTTTPSCTPNKILIRYQTDGSAVDETTCIYGESVEITATTTKTGYTFDGWIFRGDSTITPINGAFICGEKGFSSYTNVIDVYAKWTPNTFNVAYNANGGTGDAPSEPTSCTYDSACTAPANTYSKTGYEFVGWACMSGSGLCAKDVYAEGEDISRATAVNGDLIQLTAQWGQNTFTCPAGKYLPAGATVCETCPAGSYCTGGTFGYSAVVSQGVSACPMNSTSESGKSECTCDTGYTVDGTVNGATTTSGKNCEIIKVTCNPGEYLPAGKTVCTSCPTASYCVGGTFGYNADEDQGLTACPVPNNMNPLNATEAGFVIADLGDDRVLDSVEDCKVQYMFGSLDLSDPSVLEGENKRGLYQVVCRYDANTGNYTSDCYGARWYCDSGYWSELKSAWEWTGDVDPTDGYAYQGATLQEVVNNVCKPVGQNYYSFGSLSCYSLPEDQQEQCSLDLLAQMGCSEGDTECILNAMSVRHQCPDGGKTNTDTADSSADCYKTGLSCAVENGNGEQTCNYAYGTSAYDANCTTCDVTQCDTGYIENDNACAPLTYTVKYNANGGTGTMSNVTHTYDVEKALTNNAFTNGTKQFLGWSRSSSATSATYTNGQSVSNLSTTNGSTVNLYAVWGDCAPCAAGTGATCELSAPLGVCTYVGACKTGYNTLVGGDTTTPSCTANTYTVSYAGNGNTGGSAPTSPKSCTYGSACTAPANTYTKTGYTFAGWTCTGGGDSCNGNVIAAGGSLKNVSTGTAITLTAKWTANTYTVSYAGNGNTGGSAPTSPKSCTYDGTCTAPANTYTKTGYTFAGWTCTGGGDSCNGNVIAAGGSLKNVSTGTAIRLTAKWTANVYKVTLDKQGGTGGTAEYYYQYKTKENCYYYTTSDLTVCTDSSNGGTIAVPTRTGYTFGGYYTGANGSGTQYVTAAGVTTGSLYSNVAADTTLYAKWTANTYTVSFNANGGTGGQSANVTATYDAAMPAISTTAPSRTGYTFVGWYDNADYASGTQYYSETGASARTWNKTANTTLYAGWTENGYNCKSGEYLNVTSCKVCESGYYCPNGAMTYTYNGEIQGRSSCPSGYTDGGTGATTQAQCVMTVAGGKYVASKNASSATDCACGTYKAAHTVNYGDTSVCTTTDAGYYTAAGASKQIQAAPGYYAAAGACEQTKVNAGCYADETGSSTACPKSCASLGGGLYTKSDAGSDAAEDCYITTTGGYYIANLMDAEETKCEADYYCPAMTLTYPNVGGRELCPDPKVAGNVETVTDFAWLSTACPDANVGNTTIKSVAMISYGNTGLSAITQCRVQYTVDTPCAQFVIEGVRYNNEKYATTSGSRHSKKLNAGYYYTQRYSSTYCDGTGNEKRAMLYKAAAKCPANSYCPGGTVPKCNAGTYAETWGATSCTALGSFYTTSVEGATATSACYGETTAGNYISTAGDGEETCIAGSYCPGGIMVNYNSVGGSINCPGGYTAGGTGLKAQSECKISVAGGKYVGTANSSTLSTCVAGTSKAAHAVNYGQTSSCEMCSNWSYSGEGAASCTSCPSVTSGWSKTDSTGTGWKSYTSCKQTQKPANCASGVVTKTATSSTQWGTSTVTTALTANANYYVADTTCSACSGLANGFYPNSVAGNSGGSSVCYTDSLSGKYVATPKANGATDCAAGTAKAEHTVNYGETSTCDVCGENQYSEAGASECVLCATPYGYGNTGTTAEEHAGRASCKTVCDAGMYVATAGAACENVGAGYYAPGGEVSYGSISKNRGQCPVQLTTIGYGAGADEENDCGRILHIGEDKLYLRSAKKNPDELALNVRLNITNDNGGSEERVFFGNMTTEEKFMSDGVAKALKINVDDTVYYVHDDSVM